jgi:hypothetical protein
VINARCHLQRKLQKIRAFRPGPDVVYEHMFRVEKLYALANRLSELIDDMLLGDFQYIAEGRDVYADVDYERLRLHAAPLTWTPAAGRGFGPQRPAVAGPVSRRPGAVPETSKGCALKARRVSQRPSTAAARSRMPH